jgi:hypothetical protein
MYLNLLHNGKKYLYETNSKLNIGHLKELSEKILHSDKSFMHIIYNNNKYIFPNDKTFLKDLIPKGKKRTAFSIKVDDKDSPRNNETIIINDNNYKTPENTHHHASLDEALKTNLKKNFYRKFSNMWSNQKKFNNTITYKYNEFLIEIREFNRRITELYEELFQNYTQSNIKYNTFICEDNCNDVNTKLSEISQFEYQMIKFIEKEKYYYQKLNSLIKKCIIFHNNRIIVSNKNLQDLYKELFSDNIRNSDFNFNLNESEYSSNINNNFHSFDNSTKSPYSYKLFSPLEQKNSIKDTPSVFTKKNNKFSVEDSLDKTFKIKQKKTLPLLLYDSLNKENKKMLISTEIGKDGVERGKITLFGDEKKLKNKKEVKDNNKEEELGEINEEGGQDEKEDNKNDLFKNRLISRNKNSKEYNMPFKTKDEGAKNKSILKNLLSEKVIERNKLKKLKIPKQKSTIELNSNLDIINSTKNILSKKNINSNKSNNDKIHKNNSDKNNNLLKDRIDDDEANKNKDIKEDKDDKENKNDNENTISNAKSNLSDSSDLAKNKNNSSRFISSVNNSSRKTSIKNINDNNNKTNVNNEKKEVINIDKNKEDKKEINKNENNEENKNNKKPVQSLFNKNFYNKKKKEKKRRNSNVDESSNSDDDEDDDAKELKRIKSKKKKYQKDVINEANNESDESKKEKNKDPFEDVTLLRSLLNHKDDPYRRNGLIRRNNFDDNDGMKLDPIIESDEDEEKKIRLLKRKKKQYIKNKYDFLI